MGQRLATAALTILLLMFPSIRIDVLLDGAETEFYGLPLVWNSRGLATSMSKQFYLLPLAVDVCFYVLAAHLMVRLWSARRGFADASVDRAAAMLIWGCAGILALLVAPTLVMSLRDDVFLVWYDAPWRAIEHVALSFAF